MRETAPKAEGFRTSGGLDELPAGALPFVVAGLLDGWGRQVVLLPEDGHPTACHQAVDLIGDERDELVVWDYDQIYVYTQDRPSASPRRYRPRRLEDYNVSNYRAEVSIPGWADEE